MKRNKAHLLKTYVKASRVSDDGFSSSPAYRYQSGTYRPIEEFGIYLQYVRKLGFEELPDYNFLRELFTKVIRTGGYEDDSIYDWKLLNDGKGWEVSPKFTLYGIM